MRGLHTHRIVRLGLMLLLALLAAGTLLLGGRSLLAVAATDLRREGAGPVFLDRYGNRIIAHPTDLQTHLPLDQISPHLRAAVVALEDSRFWRHPGVDPVGIARALVANLRGDGIVQGASTITQQLAKNAFLTPERTFTRKVREAALALALEVWYSKEEILELYLNRAYFGEGAYGAEAAARTYFGKSAAQLTLGEAALLAGLLPAPNRYSPFRHPERALERRRLALERMAQLGLISREDAAEHSRAELALAPRATNPAGYFTSYVTDRLVESLGPELTFRGHLEVLTTLDPDVQQRASQVLAASGYQGAVVVLDLLSGDILAMVGGRNYRESPFNRAVHALRQPGSAFKPIVYAAALERHWTPSTLLEDQPKEYGDYRPANWDGTYRGRVTMQYALAHSLNAASVWLVDRLGPRAAMDMALRLGIDSMTGGDLHLALALGGLRNGVSPLRLAEAYTPFATGGVLRKGRAILRVTDREGREWPVHERRSYPAPRVLSPQVAYLMTDMLRYAVQAGTGTAARLPGVPVAGKTGTTNHQRDAWFVGYTPRHLAVVFVGHDDNRPLPGGGGALAAPLWRAIMAPLAAETGARDFPVPDGVITGVLIDPATGLRGGPGCPGSHPTAFIRGTEPTAFAPCARQGHEGETEGMDRPSEEDSGEPEAPGHDRPAAPDAPPPGLLFLRNFFRPPQGEEPSAAPGDPSERTREEKTRENNAPEETSPDEEEQEKETARGVASPRADKRTAIS